MNQLAYCPTHIQCLSFLLSLHSPLFPISPWPISFFFFLQLKDFLHTELLCRIHESDTLLSLYMLFPFPRTPSCSLLLLCLSIFHFHLHWSFPWFFQAVWGNSHLCTYFYVSQKCFFLGYGPPPLLPTTHPIQTPFLDMWNCNWATVKKTRLSLWKVR